MDFVLDQSLDAFRAEVREFLSSALPKDMAERGQRCYHEDKSDVLAWMKILCKKGWSASNWPVEFGGTGWGAAKQLVFEEECLAAGAPQRPVVGLSLTGPVIYTFGSAEQIQRHLPLIKNGETWWGQCFSEPNAGSDLASMTSTATKEGDSYRLNGHKIWTTFGQYADWLIVLAVTDKTVKPQRGISFFLVDAHSPGITMKPIYSMERGHTLNEFYFEDVVIPADGLVGEEGKGWSYAKFLLENERSWSAEIPRNKALLQRLLQIARLQIDGAGPAISRPVFREKIADITARLHALEMLTLRAMNEHESCKGERLSNWESGSMLHIKGSEMQQEIGALMMELLGSSGALYYPSYTQRPGEEYPPGPAEAHGVAADFLYRRATTIYGGSNEIQRNIIASALLGNV